MTDEEKEIFNNLKEYMQSKIDNGDHKIIYNDLDWNFKCIDCINAINNALKQSKEIEELKKYEKYYEEMEEVNKKFIAVDKIKAKIEELKKQWIVDFGVMNTVDVAIHNGIIENKIEALQSLLEKE